MCQPASAARKGEAPSGASFDIANAMSDPMSPVNPYNAGTDPVTMPGDARMAVFPYSRDQIYRIMTAPLKNTTIELAPGERLTTDPAMGDSVQWIVDKAPASGPVRILSRTMATQNGQPDSDRATIVKGKSPRNVLISAGVVVAVIIGALGFYYQVKEGNKAEEEAKLQKKAKQAEVVDKSNNTQDLNKTIVRCNVLTSPGLTQSRKPCNRRAFVPRS
nr:TrbG/VirB9 family P-type conjugative transfer protein [Paraburkholderia graminis]